jgi:hypothetical protein
VSGIDSDVVAGIELDVIAIDSGRSTTRVAADNSGGAVAADSDWVVAINSAVVRQDVVVSSDVAFEITLDGPVQTVLDSDPMEVMDLDVVATMDSAMMTMRDPG